jgi:hypothetical protein
MTRRLGAALGAIVIALVAVYLARLRDGREDADGSGAAGTLPVRPSSGPLAPAPALLSAASPFASGATSGAATRPAPHASAATDPTARWRQLPSPKPAPGSIAICGIGTAPADSDAAKVLVQQFNDQTGRAAQRLFGLMRASPDPVVRAAAQLGLGEREALANAARQTTDPAVYAMAVQACHRGDAATIPPACGLLTAGQMARLDPLNLVPWLEVANEAAARNDAGGVGEATYRASLAEVSRVREFRFADLALSAIPEDWSPRDAMLAQAKVFDIHIALQLPSYLAVVRFCGRDQMRDANRRETCQRVARVMTEHGETLIDYGIGRRIGDWSGWPADVVEAHEARLEAYKASLVDGDTLASENTTLSGCGALLRGVQTAFAHARYGELKFMNDEIARLGWSDEDILARHRAAKPQHAASAR